MREVCILPLYTAAAWAPLRRLSNVGLWKESVVLRYVAGCVVFKLPKVAECRNKMQSVYRIFYAVIEQGEYSQFGLDSIKLFLPVASAILTF